MPAQTFEGIHDRLAVEVTAATAALESSGYHPGPAERLGNFGNSEVLREVLDSSSLSDRQAMACALVESVRIAKGERGKPFTGLNRVPINWRRTQQAASRTIRVSD